MDYDTARERYFSRENLSTVRAAVLQALGWVPETRATLRYPVSTAELILYLPGSPRPPKNPLSIPKNI